MKSFLCVSIIVLFFSCKASKTNSLDIDLDAPCSCVGDKYDDSFLCFSAVGESFSEMYSKQKALSDARAELASLVHVYILTVSNNLQESKDVNTTEASLENKRKIANRQIVNQALSNIKITCERTRKTPDGKYKTYIRLETSKKTVDAAIEKTRIERGYQAL